MYHLDETCANCGHDKGTHRGTDHACSTLVDPKQRGQVNQWSAVYKFASIENKALALATKS